MRLDRNHCFKLRPATAVHWLVAVMLGVSAIAWAWHVDMPVAADDAAQVATTHAHSDGGDVVDRCDHCCHAGAHLVAILPAGLLADFDAQATYAPMPGPDLRQPNSDPPFIPPIA